MNERAPCSGCGAPLASDQHYCVECGARVAPPLALPYLTPPATQKAAMAGFVLPMPIQMATTCAALALGFGVVVGTAISPNLSGIIAGPAPQVVAQAPPPAPPAPAPISPAAPSGGAPAPVETASTFGTTEETSTGGGGGKKKKKKKKKTPLDTFDVDGTVVQVNTNAVTFALAKPSGTSPVQVLHTERVDQLPTVGQGVKTKGVRMFNDTLREVGPRTMFGGSNSVTLTGTVTYVDMGDTSAMATADEEVYVVSTVGASIAVRIPEGSGPNQAETTDSPPVGSNVTAPVEIRSVSSRATGLGGLALAPPPPAPTGCPPPGSAFGPPAPPTHVLEQGSGMAPPAPDLAKFASIEAIVQATCPDASKMLVSADDIRERGVDQELNVASGIDLSRYTPGESVVANIALDPGGASRITGIASDQGVTGARDNLQGQGDMAGPPVDDLGTPKKKRKKKK